MKSVSGSCAWFVLPPSAPGSSPHSSLSRLLALSWPLGVTAGPSLWSIMAPWCRCVWLWCCLLSLGVLTRSLELQDLFEFGEEAGDQQLRPGSDSTAELLLNGSVWFFGQSLDRVYVSSFIWFGPASVPEDSVVRSSETRTNRQIQRCF